MKLLTYCYYWKTSEFSLKSPKTSLLAVRDHFLTFRKITTPDVFDEKSKTGLGFEIRQPQRKCQRRPTLQSMANPAVEQYQIFSNINTRKRSYYHCRDCAILVEDLDVRRCHAPLFGPNVFQREESWIEKGSFCMVLLLDSE